MHCNNHITDAKIAHPINMKKGILTSFTPSKNNMECLEDAFLSSRQRTTLKLLRKEREREI